MSSETAITAAETPAANGHGEAHSTAGFKALMLGSIGVVYGDIGTSPLYALREAVVAASEASTAATPQAVLGVLSLILWALIVVVTLKYVVILLRADNNGEGGTLALMALAQRAVTRGGGAIVLLGIISGALFYGDAVLTPALSVLSARSRMTTYFSVTTTINAHRISESTPSTACGVASAAPPLAATTASRSA